MATTGCPQAAQTSDAATPALSQDFTTQEGAIPLGVRLSFWIHFLNTQELAMNGYKAFYKGRQTDVTADTSYEAQKKAAAFFKAKKSHEVTVVLCEKKGKQVTHTPDF